MDTLTDCRLSFEFQCNSTEAATTLERHPSCVSASVPLIDLITFLTRHELVQIARLHGERVLSGTPVAECIKLLTEHSCTGCIHLRSVFKIIPPAQHKQRTSNKISTRLKKKKTEKYLSDARILAERFKVSAEAHVLRASRKRATGRIPLTSFPPRPLSTKETHGILTRYCKTIDPRNFMEKGCAVCGYLVPIKHLTRLSAFKGDLNLLERGGVTRKERFHIDDHVEELTGPVLAEGCNHICVDCETALSNGVVPKLALARHNWVGVVPDALKDLTFAEGLMIAKIRHNRCVVRVNSGRVRMSANAIMFSSPVLTV
ncbi:hypothetical protein C8R43DRAFT_893485, partial [Mycena crocata]